NRIIAGVYIGGTYLIGSDGQRHGDSNGTGYATALTSGMFSWIQSVENAGSGNTYYGRRIYFGGGGSQSSISTSTSVVASSYYPTSGDYVTFTATVSASSGTASGTVSF